MAHDVFISHSARDKAVADEVCSSLENAGLGCWIAPRDVRPGRSFAGEITRAIQQSKVMVLVFSGHSNSSQQVLREVQLAVESNLHILQFRIENLVLNDDLRYFLGTPQWFDALTPPLEGHLQRLESATKELLGQSVVPPSVAETAPERPIASVPMETAPPAVPSAHETRSPLPQAREYARSPRKGRTILAAALAVIGTAFLITLSWNMLSARKANRATVTPPSTNSKADAVEPPASPPSLAQAEKDHELGMQYFRGGGTVLINHRKSFDLIERAAKQRLPEGEARLATLLNDGSNIDFLSKPDRAKATEWAKKALADGLETKAQASNHTAEFELATLFRSGLGVSGHEAEALKLYESAANHGNSDAKQFLGFMYMSGQGVAKDLGTAERYFQQAAGDRIATAELWLGILYRGSNPAVPKNPSQAIAMLRRAADQGNPAALEQLGECYEKGEGVNQDYSQAAELYQKASDRGYWAALMSLARLYERGQGVPKDLGKAAELYKKVADLGISEGTKELERLKLQKSS